MKKKLWTVTVNYKGGLLLAQCKSSLEECIKRVLADDPIWYSATVRVVWMKMLNKRLFRRGLAIQHRHHGQQ